MKYIWKLFECPFCSNRDILLVNNRAQCKICTEYGHKRRQQRMNIVEWVI